MRILWSVTMLNYLWCSAARADTKINEAFFSNRLEGVEPLERCDCVLCEFNLIIICYLVNIRLIRCAPA